MMGAPGAAGWVSLVVAVLCGLGTPARAEMNGDQVLQLSDETMTKAQDNIMVWKCTTRESGKPDRELTFQVTTRGTQFRRVEILGPGDVKGMRVLIRSLSQIYVFIPAQKKVRRVASHVRERTFMGTTFNFDEMSAVVYTPIFAGQLLAETTTHWKVEGSRKPDQSFPYARLEFDVDKQYKQPTEIRYFNEKDAKIKTSTFTNFSCQGEVCSPNTVVMIDHVLGGKSSTLERTGWKINTGVEESFFTERSLTKGT